MKSKDVVDLAADQPAFKVFQQVAEDRRVRLGELIQQVELDRETVQVQLEKLKDRKLVDIVEGPIQDSGTYYLTAEGFSLERELRKLDLTKEKRGRFKIGF